MKRFLIGTFAVTAIVALSFGATVAFAAAPSEVGETRSDGHCSYGSTFHQAMEPDIGIEMEVGVETGVAGQTWKVKMDYNGHTFFTGTEATEEDGGFEIKQQPGNREGDDVFHAVLFNPVTLEVCEGTLTAPL
jgi:hypothetical protein